VTRDHHDGDEQGHANDDNSNYDATDFPLFHVRFPFPKIFSSPFDDFYFINSALYDTPIRNNISLLTSL
jgi:hypothetical protein